MFECKPFFLFFLNFFFFFGQTVLVVCIVLCLLCERALFKFREILYFTDVSNDLLDFDPNFS